MYSRRKLITLGLALISPVVATSAIACSVTNETNTGEKNKEMPNRDSSMVNPENSTNNSGNTNVDSNPQRSNPDIPSTPDQDKGLSSPDNTNMDKETEDQQQMMIEDSKDSSEMNANEQSQEPNIQPLNENPENEKKDNNSHEVNPDNEAKTDHQENSETEKNITQDEQDMKKMETPGEMQQNDSNNVMDNSDDAAKGEDNKQSDGSQNDANASKELKNPETQEDSNDKHSTPGQNNGLQNPGTQQNNSNNNPTMPEQNNGSQDPKVNGKTQTPPSAVPPKNSEMKTPDNSKQTKPNNMVNQQNTPGSTNNPKNMGIGKESTENTKNQGKKAPETMKQEQDKNTPSQPTPGKPQKESQRTLTINEIKTEAIKKLNTLHQENIYRVNMEKFFKDNKNESLWREAFMNLDNDLKNIKDNGLQENSRNPYFLITKFKNDEKNENTVSTNVELKWTVKNRYNYFAVRNTPSGLSGNDLTSRITNPANFFIPYIDEKPMSNDNNVFYRSIVGYGDHGTLTTNADNETFKVVIDGWNPKMERVPRHTKLSVQIGTPKATISKRDNLLSTEEVLIIKFANNAETDTQFKNNPDSVELQLNIDPIE